jgi:hypothetical protein
MNGMKGWAYISTEERNKRLLNVHGETFLKVTI